MDNMHFALFSPDWGADEELSLLEGVEIFGFGSWQDISEQVDTKSASQCKSHYIETYLDSATSPLPDPGKAICQQSKVQMPMAPPQQKPKPGDRRGGPTSAQQKVAGSARTAKPQIQHEAEMIGYSPLRDEFDTEWANDAELLIKDIAFTPEDTPDERELKFQALESYTWKVHERHRRKRFVIEHNKKRRRS
eukprot:TRINITY_DN5055_c0_g1_i1.p1 TRINITY_DN5055_c0_g1~~TRINITY_DN5055_c0_g1_i1.p1  ORF type:complete len:192 (-),score=32.84 TRINITY_DN5055_c0_g1_i1:570-1145(-)